MKYNGLYTCFLFLSVLLMPFQGYSQLDLFNKKESLQDLNYKTLVVVLENDSMVDLALREAVEKKWELSDFRFCDTEEFDKIKGDTSYYFLVRVKGIFKKEREPAIEFLSLLKGGPAGVKGVDKMADILSLQLQPADDREGRIVPFIESYINIIQSHVLRIQRKKIAAHIGLAWYANRLSGISGKKVLINEEDLAGNLSREAVERLLKNGVSLADETEIDQALARGDAATLVTLCVAPGVEQQGSYCYKMLISTDNNELFYYKKQKVSPKTPKGFLKDDIEAIVFYFK